MAETGQETIRFSQLVKRAVEESYAALNELIKKSPQQSDSERKIGLLKYFNKTRQRLLRLHVLTKWCIQIPLVQYCQQLDGSLSSHEMCFTQAADTLFFTHEGLQQARAPSYDVASALEILLTGSYCRLPKCIEDLSPEPTLVGEEREKALQKLNTLLRSKLLDLTIPKEISNVSIVDGKVILLVEGEFKAHLTLGYCGHLSLWRLLHLELLVGEKNRLLKLSEGQKNVVCDDLQRRMAAAEHPFITLYSVLHEFCISLVMDTVIRQVKILRQGRWKDAIRFELISDSGSGQCGIMGQMQTLPSDAEADTSGMKTPGVKILYWLDPVKGIGGGDSGCVPFLKIEPSQDQHIVCSHSTFVIDPMTGNEAKFILDQSYIDVERLLLRAISCNIHTRLLELERVLKSNDKLCQADDDVILKLPGDQAHSSLNKVSELSEKATIDSRDLSEEVLCVRAYGLCYVALGINIRNGRYILCFSRDPVLSTAISELEDALNQGSRTPIDVFISFRNKSILDLFAINGKFLGLKLYEKGTVTGKIPKSIVQGSDLLLTAFPNCGNSFFLLIQLDMDFKPIFYLLESCQDTSGGSDLISGPVHVTRYNKIDVGELPMVEDEVNLSLLDNELSTFSSKEGAGLDMICESSFTREGSTQSTIQQQGGTHSFSSMVDDIFEYDKALKPEKSGFTPRPDSTSQFSSSRYVSSSLHMASPSGETPDYSSFQGGVSIPMDMYSLRNRKRNLSDIVNNVPSLQRIVVHGETQKKRKMIHESGNPQSINIHSKNIQGSVGQFTGYTYGSIVMEANIGKVPTRIYVAVLLQVVRYCSLCIKHARLISQMDALKIPFIENISMNKPSPDIWFRLPSSIDHPWKQICLCLGKPGNTYWDVKVSDEHFRDLWELQKGRSNTPWGAGIRIANTSDVDSHIRLCPEGIVLSYKTVEDDSIQKLVADLQRLYNARSFALGMRKLLEAKDERSEVGKDRAVSKVPGLSKLIPGEGGDKAWELLRRTFKIEAVGLMSIWFSYFGSMPGVIARFVVEWEAGKEGCTMHVSPDQLWPHTKFLEDFINGGEVASLLDCIRLTAGPLHALAGAIRPARMVGTSTTGITMVPSGIMAASKTNGIMLPQGLAQGTGSSAAFQSTGGLSGVLPNGGGSSSGANLNTQNGSVVSNSGRGGTGIVPSSLLPTDVSVVLRNPYWIRIIYRKNFAVDMRCFAGDQVWLQPATPPKGGPSEGGSMPCPQFRPFIMEHVALGLNTLEPSLTPHAGSPGSSTIANTNVSQASPAGTNRLGTGSPGVSRPNTLPGNSSIIFNRVSNVSNLLGTQNSGAFNTGMPGMPFPGRPIFPGGGMPGHFRGELNTAFIGLGDDGGYGGGWVPLVALKKVLRGILKYLGVLWLFSQLPELLTVTLRSILKENEGALLNLDQEQPALRFFIGGYVFAVSVHRIQLLLQVLSVRRFHQQQQQQQQQQQNQISSQDELSPHEIAEICDYFSRRVASEPYDASRVASFITLLTLPISVLREFLKLITWKRGTAQGQNSDISPQRPRVELCLENHRGVGSDPSATSEGGETSNGSSVAKSNIHYDRVHNAVEFGLTVVLDPASIPHVNAAGGAAWLPHCVSVRLKYSFGENPQMSLLKMEGSHGGRACWPRTEDWERCKQKVAKAIEIIGSGSGASGSPVDISQGRLRVVAETLQHSLQSSLHQLRRSTTSSPASMPGNFPA